MRELFTAILIAGLQVIYGQQQGPLMHSLDMYPKSPDAASLSQFTDIPPGAYNGVAAFSIPLYSIDLDGFRFPIELNYNASGIKVNQISSRVGLGWALNTAGVSLSEQVIGVRDRTFRINLPDGFNPNGLDADEVHQGIAGELTDPAVPFEDVTPDVYTYQIANGSGRFIFDSHKGFGIPMPYNQLQIKWMNQRSGINILDEKGISYDFLQSLAFYNGNTCITSVGPTNTTLSYFPSTVITPQGKSITFEYRMRNSNNRAQFVNSLTQQKVVDSYTTPGSSATHVLTAENCFNYSISFEELLKKITFPEGSVNFYYNDETIPNSVREDLPNDVYLTEVVVKNNNNDIIKNFTLIYDYFTSNDEFELTPPASLPQIFDGINKRLKLKEVVDNLTEVKYELFYYDDHLLPHRLSYSQDWWGVYNGKSNTTSIPTATYDKRSSNGEVVKFLELGADKYPDFNFGVIGNLKKIKYPTGGTTEISYEADTFSSDIPFTKKIYSDSHANAVTSGNSYVDSPFTVEDNSFHATITFYGSDTHNQPGGTSLGRGKLQIIKKGTQNDVVFNTDKTGEYIKKLAPGDYSLRVFPGKDPDNNLIHCSGHVMWFTEHNDTNFNGLETGTIRVQKIVSTGENDDKITRIYTYLDPETEYTTSSGKNQGQMFFNSIKKYEYPGGTNGEVNSKTVLINNQSFDSQISNGKPIGYTYVQEIYSSSTDSTEGYKKEYKYKNEDILEHRDPNSLLYIGWPIKNQKNGLLLSETLFDSAGNVLKKIEHDYDFDNYFNHKSSAYKQSAPDRINGATVSIPKNWT